MAKLKISFNYLQRTDVPPLIMEKVREDLAVVGSPFRLSIKPPRPAELRIGLVTHKGTKQRIQFMLDTDLTVLQAEDEVQSIFEREGSRIESLRIRRVNGIGLPIPTTR